MIYSLQGKLETIGAGWAIINVGGVGFLVHMGAATLGSLGAPHSEVKLYTHLHLREDGVALYGFSAPEELSLFQLLLSVSGLGPRLALAMLSAINVGQLILAIATGNVDLLTIVPGIGKKVASRIILELKDKIGAGIAAPVPEMVRENADVLAALTSLGYSAAEATKAVASLPDNADLGLEEKVRLALQYFSTG
ncbi:MAG: Holliday junction branch migration protein RuvA [Chloroflexota bacterium]